MQAVDFNRFSQNPTFLDITRSRFDRSHTHKTTFNAGDLIPIYCEEVLPGDSFVCDVSMVARMSTPIHPVMDNAFMDIFFFAVPNRLLWEHWREFMGQSQVAFAPDVEYEIPTMILNSNEKGSIFDHFGIPIGGSFGSSTFKKDFLINALPIRAYALIWNEWFRDQNVFNPINIPLTDATVTALGKGNSQTWFDEGVEDLTIDGARCGRPLPVAKYHDYFTSALPMPQKGPAVTLPLVDEDIISVGPFSDIRFPRRNPLLFTNTSGGNVSNGYLGVTSQKLGIDNSSTLPTPSNLTDILPVNLGWETSQLNAISVNVLRQAFAMQKLFERDARGGTRYIEIIRSHFGVQSPDARQQRPEYIGGKRIPISMQQVLQTSATNEVSPQGNAAANSLTSDRFSAFTYSATEHMYIIGLACCRTDHTYQQGISKMWTRKRRYDFFWPVFANLGEQPIYNRELYVGRGGLLEWSKNDEVFGYQEAWAEYRYHPGTVSGAFRSDYETSLDVWHYADNFKSLPTLSPEFISETRTNIDRTLAVTSAVEDQFIVDFYFKNIATRPMPLYSIPGLIDHH